MNENQNNLRPESSILRDIRWELNRYTWMALLSYLFVVLGLYTAFQVFTIDG
jgi:hypothetical protein